MCVLLLTSDHAKLMKEDRPRKSKDELMAEFERHRVAMESVLKSGSARALSVTDTHTADRYAAMHVVHGRRLHRQGPIRPADSKMNAAAVELAKRGMGVLLVFAPAAMVNALMLLLKSHISAGRGSALKRSIRSRRPAPGKKSAGG